MSSSKPAWRKLSLAAAGLYNLAWGAFVVAFPGLLFQWVGMPAPNYPELWQCIGMIVGVYGIGYLIASTDPLRHWPITLVGFLGKLLGPIGFAKAVWEGRFAPEFFWVILANDLIWLLPFGLILTQAYQETKHLHRGASPEVQKWALLAKTQYGISILEHSRLRPVLLVFLRHVGCPFCREALSDLAQKRRSIEETGTQIVLVHMGREEAAEEILGRYSLLEIPRVADPNLKLYEAFGLERGSFAPVIGPGIWPRGIKAGIIDRHGIGLFEGDVTQMPGVFLVFHGETLKTYRHQSVADRPDYLEMVNELAEMPRG